MSETDLFSPCSFNGLALKNRIALSPLTRSRADMAGHTSALQATYYAQRASAGLLISEATAVTPGGRGAAFVPGLWDDSQIAPWKLTTDAVHAAGGVIFCQLWHAGRMSHSSLSLTGEAPISPSDMHQPGSTFVESGLAPFDAARALRLDEIPALIESYRAAARRALAAGFDGVELHAAHSYLIDSFLRDMTNHRTDAYGGPIENRVRLMSEVLEAMVEVYGRERVMIRICPIGHAYNAWDSNPEPLFTHVVERLNDIGVGWLDLVEGDTGVTRSIEPSFDLQKLRRLFKGPVIANNLYDRAMALEALRTNAADLIAFGRPFIGNPDLVDRLKRNAPLVDARRSTHYTGGAAGYTDWPTLDEAAATA
jgi:N-ethylmaleimide reductase